MYADSFEVGEKTGWLVFSKDGLHSLHLPKKRATQPPRTTLRKHKLTQNLKAYFEGQKVGFNAKIDWDPYSGFQREVLEKCRLVAYGQTKSYQHLARTIKRPAASRAVGNALAKNRLPIVIPCHRIVRSDGKLGGFSNSQYTKGELLDLEGNGRHK